MTPDEIIERLRASLRAERQLRIKHSKKITDREMANDILRKEVQRLKAHNRYLNAVIEQMRGELTTQARGLADLDRIVLQVKADAERKRR